MLCYEFINVGVDHLSTQLNYKKPDHRIEINGVDSIESYIICISAH